MTLRNETVLWVVGATLGLGLLLTVASGCQEECANSHTDCIDVPDEHDELDDLPDENADDFSALERSYCDCMLLNCHDEFHQVWGVDDVEARDNCRAEISQVPSVGSDTTTGNSQECRVHFCEVAAERNCDAAMGLNTCN